MKRNSTGIAQVPIMLRLTVQNLNTERLLRPYRAGGWHVQQIVHHLADNDMNAYAHFNRDPTEDAPIVGSYREELWAELNYHRINLAAYL